MLDQNNQSFWLHTLRPIGYTVIHALHKGKCYELRCEVVNEGVPNILAQDSEMLGFVCRVYANYLKL